MPSALELPGYVGGAWLRWSCPATARRSVPATLPSLFAYPTKKDALNESVFQ